MVRTKTKMKQMRSIFFIKVVFLLVVFSFFTTGQGLLLSGDRTGQPVLARVEVAGMVNDLGLPVYAHLQDAAGHDYALVIAARAQLEQAGVRYRILDKHTRGAEYFIISMFPANKPVPTERLDNVLLDDGVQVIIRSTVEKAKVLVESGFNVQKLRKTPLVWPEAPGQQLISATAAVEYNAAIAQLISQVTQGTVDTYVRNLSGVNAVNIGGSSYTITTRNTASGTPVTKATQYMYEFMQGLGLTVSYHNWSSSGYSSRNVVGELPGTTQPGEIVLVTAHLDDMPSSGTAPGADDNASGSVGVMVSAEMLSQQQFYRTVRFVFFTGEEQWLLGSAAYADLVYGNGDNIVAVYNMDMISYDAINGPTLRLHTRTTSSPGYAGDLAIANTFIDVVNAYSLSGSLSPIIDADGITQSDHSSFWDNGYSAILGIQDHDSDISPYYHTSSDTVSTINMTYFTNFVKASVGTVSHLAIIDDGVLLAGFTGYPTSGPAPLTVQFTDQSTGATSWSWNFGDGGTSTLQNPSHTYTTAGTYTVSLTVTNASGSDIETKANYITVTAPQPPVAAFTGSPTSVTVGGAVTFTDQSTNNPTSWSWTFAGGTPGTSTVKNPVITYNTAGTYNVTLIATNAQGSNTLTKTNYITVTATTYCTSSGNSQADEWIARVKVGNTLNNSSGASPYTDFTSLTANLPSAGGSVSYELVPGFSGSAYTEYWRIWIDYNRDSDFADTGEQCISVSGSTTRTGSFTVYSGVTNGNTRMRVTMKYGGAPTYCGTFSYGEVEDYTANIGGEGVTYCTSSGTSQADEWIGRVQIGALDKSSGASPYSDYTSIITNMTRGTVQNVTLTPAFSGSAYTEYWAVWIDYNKNGVFTDTGESVFSKSGTSAVTGTFTVSSSASTGNTRMRVTMKYGSAPTSCGTFSYGEVEDYTANIQ